MPFLGLGIKKAKRMQLYHHDNTDLEFRRLPIIGQSTTEFDERNNPVRSWLDYFKTLYPFNGYKGIPADAVQLAYGRHFHLELHDILSDKERPPDENSLNNPFIKAIAELRAYLLSKAAKPRSAWDKLTIIMGIMLGLEMVIWGILVYVSRH